MPYRDTLGIWTVGYGHNIDGEDLLDLTRRYSTVGGLLSWLTHTITHNGWLDQDIAQAVDDAQTFVGNDDVWGELEDLRQEVIAEMAFQMGLARLSGFVKFHQAILLEDFDGAAKEMLDSRWANQTPRRAKSLAEKFKSGA